MVAKSTIMLSESVIEGAVCDYATVRGWLVRKLGWIGRRGAPDRLFMKGGRAIFVEFKATGEKPDPIQVREIARMRSAGMEVHVIDDIEAGNALFD
jgi:hypothetical protein